MHGSFLRMKLRTRLLLLLSASGLGSGCSALEPPDGDAASPVRSRSGIERPDLEYPRLVGAGDIASCSETSDEATAQIIDDIFSTGVEGVVFAAGDNAYNSGSMTDYMQCYDPTWGRHKARTRPAVGNHDYRTRDAAGYFGYFGDAAGTPDQGYYSYDLGEWHIVVVNSNCAEIGGCGEGSPQARWLRDDLAAHPTACTAAYWHHPRFSSGWHGDDEELADIWALLYDSGADVVITGHDHDYERFAPLDAAGNEDRTHGVRQFVVGTGGRYLRGFTGRPHAHSELRNSDVHGVLELTLRPGAYDWRFIAEAGATFEDSGTESCH